MLNALPILLWVAAGGIALGFASAFVRPSAPPPLWLAVGAACWIGPAFGAALSASGGRLGRTLVALLASSVPSMLGSAIATQRMRANHRPRLQQIAVASASALAFAVIGTLVLIPLAVWASGDTI